MLKQENQQIKQQLAEAHNKIMSHNSNITAYSNGADRTVCMSKMYYES